MIKIAEEKLQKLIEKYGLANKLTVEMVKGWVYNEEGEPLKSVHKFQDKCLSYFTNASNADDLNEILEVFNDAWNYFPHKSLGGKSPNQMVENYKQKK